MSRSPLFDLLQTAGAQFAGFDGSDVPAVFSSVEQEYRTLRQAVGCMDLSHRGRLLVRGTDAPRFLHGMVSNEVKALEIGHGNYAFLLDVHGHILADVRVLRLDKEQYLLDCDSPRLSLIRDQLDRHIISDDVELEDQSSELTCIAFEGPQARQTLSSLLPSQVPVMKELEHRYVEGLDARLVRASLIGGEGYWLLCPPSKAREFWQTAVNGSAAQRRIEPVGFQALEIGRVEAGIPRYGLDMDEKTLPQETGRMNAISFSKGCYIGQEVVERIRSRGHVNRERTGLRLSGDSPALRGAEVTADGKVAGETGSSVYSFGLRHAIALAMLRREYRTPGTTVRVDNRNAEVVGLPFVSSGPLSFGPFSPEMEQS